MNKIDKTNNRALAFVEALQEYTTQNNGQHPDYEKGTFRNKHYKNVFFALLFCQKGLCAYTEQLLCDTNLMLESDWQNNEYKGNILTKKIGMDIDHFDPTTKKTNGWDWDNLFLLNTAINRKDKLAQKVFDFFKPDLSNFSIENYVNYRFDKHIFVVKANWKFDKEQPDMYEKIGKMIEVLGLNYDSTIIARKNYLDEKQKMIIKYKEAVETIETELTQFFTAFRLSKIHLQSLI